MTARARDIQVWLDPQRGDAGRTLTLYGVTPTRALRALAERLATEPGLLRFRAGPRLDQVELLTTDPHQAAAVVTSGITFDEIRQARRDLTRQLLSRIAA